MSETLLRIDGPVSLDFETFFQREHVRLGRAVYLLTCDAAEAEDLVQEAMARVYERWDRVSRLAEPAGYVYRVASNLHRRRFGRRRRMSQLLAGNEPSERDHADAASRSVDVWTALDTLTREQRDAVILVEFLGYDAAAAGEVLGIEPVSVRVRLHRARAKLREAFGGNDE
jgi:RNA polymerase sigma factor (sigma-70 family)